MPIHATAIIDPHAEIDASADVGAYAVVEAGVKIGPGCKIWHHAFIAQGTTLGQDVQVHPFAVIGHHPQDLGWKHTPSYTSIGDGTILREYVSIHRGTPPETTTIIGKRCFFMASSHAGHNALVGDNVILANSAALGGHVHVGDRTFVSACAAVQQFTRIGELAMVGGGLRITSDAAPFMMFGPAGPMGPNVVGLRRAGISAEERTELRMLYRVLFRAQQPLSKQIAHAETIAQTAPGRRLIAFLRGPSRRGYMRYKGLMRPSAAEEDGM